MYKTQIGPAAGLILAAGLLEHTWGANVAASLWLGPTLVMSLSPVLGYSPLIYWLAALIAILWQLSGGFFVTMALIPVHFLLVRLAWRRQSRVWFLSATLSPWAVLAFFVPVSWQYVLGGAVSVCVQYVLGWELRNQLSEKMLHLELRARQAKAAHGAAIAGSIASQLGKLEKLVTSVGDHTDAVYGVYQELELSVRANPTIDERLPGRVLAASQDSHRLKLRLTELSAELQEELQRLSSQEGATLGTISGWVGAKMEAEAATLQKTVYCLLESGEDPVIELQDQLQLVWLLQTVCRLGLQELNASTVWVSFSGYQSSGRLRVVITMRGEDSQPGSEWPILAPLPLKPWPKTGRQHQVECKRGVTSDGQLIFTLELN